MGADLFPSDLHSRESLDEGNSSSAAVGAEVAGSRLAGRGRGYWRRQKSFPTTGQHGSPVTVGQESEMSDAHEASRQHVEHETPEKLSRRQRHLAALVAVRVVSPAKRDRTLAHRQ